MVEVYLRFRCTCESLESYTENGSDIQFLDTWVIFVLCEMHSLKVTQFYSNTLNSCKKNSCVDGHRLSFYKSRVVSRVNNSEAMLITLPTVALSAVLPHSGS